MLRLKGHRSAHKGFDKLSKRNEREIESGSATDSFLEVLALGPQGGAGLTLDLIMLSNGQICQVQPRVEESFESSFCLARKYSGNSRTDPGSEGDKV